MYSQILARSQKRLGFLDCAGRFRCYIDISKDLVLHLKEKLKLDAHGMQVGKSKVFLKDSGTHSSGLRGMGVDTRRTCFRMAALIQILEGTWRDNAPEKWWFDAGFATHPCFGQGDDCNQPPTINLSGCCSGPIGSSACQSAISSVSGKLGLAILRRRHLEHQRIVAEQGAAAWL